MKSILSASICTAALAFAIPAMAATDTTTPVHHHHHHAGKTSQMGPKTHHKMAGDPSTEDLNAKSLAAARGGAAPTSGDSTAAPATAAPTTPGAASTAPMAPTSGTTSTTTPTNAPGGQ